MAEEKPDDLPAILFEELKRREAKGESAISFNQLFEWLGSLPPTRIRDRNFEAWKATAPLEHGSRLELFRSVIEAGQTALKTLIAMNGGAAAALLAFLGNLVTKQANPTLQAGISYAMLWFVGGVALAGFSTAGRYLTQWCASGVWPKTAYGFNWFSIVTGLAS